MIKAETVFWGLAVAAGTYLLTGVQLGSRSAVPTAATEQQAAGQPITGCSMGGGGGGCGCGGGAVR